MSNGENAYGLRTVAAPVLDTAAKPIAGVSLTIAAERMPLEEFVALAMPEITRVADILTQAVQFSFGTIAQSVQRA